MHHKPVTKTAGPTRTAFLCYVVHTSRHPCIAETVKPQNRLQPTLQWIRNFCSKLQEFSPPSKFYQFWNCFWKKTLGTNDIYSGMTASLSWTGTIQKRKCFVRIQWKALPRKLISLGFGHCIQVFYRIKELGWGPEHHLIYPHAPVVNSHKFPPPFNGCSIKHKRYTV